ncbi:CIA30 family protein [Cellvibrio sp. pealriver]|uniref:CIA30 family protein n=1 Tax=Cellvibrio sp. pealriver TaxID=1622269 RepID=UPI00066FE114|nr:CIA30 family protein [Cellvibrio sp. pealriver]
MNNRKASALTFIQPLLLSTLLASASISFGSGMAPVVDDFSNAQLTSLGFPRYFVNDTMAGGNTKTEQEIVKGVISTKGEIIPPRGQPGWASIALPLEAQGTPKDSSAFEGVRLLIKVNSGNLSVSANSTEVSNFDYHGALIAVAADGKFHEVKIPFNSMKRSWSEQTPLNPKTLNSISITAYDMAKGSFDFAVDEVSFY